MFKNWWKLGFVALLLIGGLVACSSGETTPADQQEQPAATEQNGEQPAGTDVESDAETSSEESTSAEDSDNAESADTESSETESSSN